MKPRANSYYPELFFSLLMLLALLLISCKGEEKPAEQAPVPATLEPAQMVAFCGRRQRLVPVGVRRRPAHGAPLRQHAETDSDSAATAQTGKERKRPPRPAPGHLLRTNQYRHSTAQCRRAVDVQRENLQIANEVVEQTKVRLGQALATTQDVLDAKATLRDTQLNFLQALHDLMITRLE